MTNEASLPDETETSVNPQEFSQALKSLNEAEAKAAEMEKMLDQLEAKMNAILEGASTRLELD
ncbi:hypothetical protein BABINDRAFT_5568 [Babjeviella inositovora NRRL Y-12698]|uniref:Uncharacterized protein n=1 Tax=Babjeviella inositovora NRRL Y-12698 TaxID=984486 RepID=A0A1E3QY86_9ASCO|nr:uncharacterized protein BABINDRAFT_5568 [Babjeviella inositovora NRRL Y-12698]ODQ82630.1 hypothetical protein BABINDRAFT_5568 [Babjeviella inositovora NRRL Y-12698]